jgi:drug/metabolite transporter (DMT)-like permease
MKNYNRSFVYILAVVNAIIVGLSFLFTKTAVTLSNPLDTMAHRFTVAIIVILILWSMRIIKFNIHKDQMRKLIPLSIFYPALFFSFQAFGLKYSPSSEGGIIFATIPIITMLLASVFLKEKTNLYQKLFILLSVSGVIFIFIMKGSTIEIKDLSGLTLLLLSCLSISSYTVSVRSLAKQFKPIDITVFMMVSGFVFFNLAAGGTHLIKGDFQNFYLPLMNPSFLFSVVYLGLFASLITALLSNIILAKIKASQMSVFANLSTVTSIIAGYIFLGESIYPYHIIGAVMIIIGVICTNVFASSSKESHPIQAKQSKDGRKTELLS